MELHTSTSTVAITHLCQLLYQEFDTHMAYMCAYILSEVITIETMSKVSEWLEAYSGIAPSAARDGDMLSV